MIVEANSKTGIGLTKRGTRRWASDLDCCNKAGADQLGLLYSGFAACMVCSCEASLCRARTRTSGFRARMQTPSGRAVLKARRKKGRHTLCPASNFRK